MSGIRLLTEVKLCSSLISKCKRCLSIQQSVLCGKLPEDNRLSSYERSVEEASQQINIKLSPDVKQFISEEAALCQANRVVICDGSKQENQKLLSQLQSDNVISPLPKYDNCWLALSDPNDVARVEGRTVICTNNSKQTVPTPKSGFPVSPEKSLPNLKSTQVGNWMSIDDGRKELLNRYPGCMKGRTMYVIPYCMGSLHSPLSKYGLQLTDSAYVVACMRIMTRMSKDVFDIISQTNEFVRCLHSVGVPLPSKLPIFNNWPCNPSKTIISHFPDSDEILSFGSGYGGNALCGKKCFALRIGSNIAKRQGWLAEHMLILGITNQNGVKKYVAAAFPSACGKTNLAMLNPTIPGYKVECVGDDIAWMRFNDKGQLVAINPESGFFGVAPGTSYQSNPNAMETIKHDTMFTNVAKTSDGGVFWEGMDEHLWKNNVITTWKNKIWDPNGKEPAAHPNSRFCAPAARCPVMDSDWENPRGVPIEAILFGGRRPEGVPLVYESFDWAHGVFVGASVKSETTAAAEHNAKQIMHDPFAMRPFFGYNFGHYLSHWLSFQRNEVKLPKIFHVNWFRKSKKGDFLWPGFGDNIRVLDWIFRRCEGEDIVHETPIGYVPKYGSLNTTSLSKSINFEELLSVDKQYWIEDLKETTSYLNEVLHKDMPEAIKEQIDSANKRLNN
ncbi:hypothetical protein GJ496_009303 [Pomphorhynchus laevis]|nr:hypothetical protein GJ496_009303 [Pomphorhynchus laevis]